MVYADRSNVGAVGVIFCKYIEWAFERFSLPPNEMPAYMTQLNSVQNTISYNANTHIVY